MLRGIGQLRTHTSRRVVNVLVELSMITKFPHDIVPLIAAFVSSCHPPVAIYFVLGLINICLSKNINSKKKNDSCPLQFKLKYAKKIYLPNQSINIREVNTIR